MPQADLIPHLEVEEIILRAPVSTVTARKASEMIESTRLTRRPGGHPSRIDLRAPVVMTTEDQDEGQVKSQGDQHGSRELAPAAEDVPGEKRCGDVMDGPLHGRDDPAWVLLDQQRWDDPSCKRDPAQGQGGVERDQGMP